MQPSLVKNAEVILTEYVQAPLIEVLLIKSIQIPFVNNEQVTMTKPVQLPPVNNAKMTLTEYVQP